MKTTGYILITIGFIAASLISVTDILEVNWNNFLFALAISIVGIILVRLGTKKQSLQPETLASNMKVIENSLQQIVKDVKKIRSEINPKNPQEVHHKIDEILPAHLNNFIESRKSIGHIYGLENYAHIMNYFATAERYLNRVWSASTDGYIDEIIMYMEKCEQQFESALTELKNLVSRN